MVHGDYRLEQRLKSCHMPRDGAPVGTFVSRHSCQAFASTAGSSAAAAVLVLGCWAASSVAGNAPCGSTANAWWRWRCCCCC